LIVNINISVNSGFINEFGVFFEMRAVIQKWDGDLDKKGKGEEKT